MALGGSVKTVRKGKRKKQVRVIETNGRGKIAALANKRDETKPNWG